MTNEEPRKQAAEWAERTATEQGLPAKVTDHRILREVARLLGLLAPEQSEVE